MSMNLYVGGFAPGTDGVGVCGCLQDLFEAHRIDVPVKIFVFLDMREDRVNWSNFMADMTVTAHPIRVLCLDQ